MWNQITENSQLSSSKSSAEDGGISWTPNALEALSKNLGGLLGLLISREIEKGGNLSVLRGGVVEFRVLV